MCDVIDGSCEMPLGEWACRFMWPIIVPRLPVRWMHYAAREQLRSEWTPETVALCTLRRVDISLMPARHFLYS